MIPPNCHALATRCRMCRGDMTLWIADDSDPRWEAMLVPMATHDRCFDIWQRRMSAGEVIQRTCCTLYAIELEGKNVSVNRRAAHKAASDTARETLKVACREYMVALAEAKGMEWWQPVDEMVEMLSDHPSKWVNILKVARQGITDLSRKQTAPVH